MGAERLVVDLLLWLSYAIQVTGMDTYAIVASVLLQVITGFLGSSHPRLNSVACAAASQILSPCHSCHVLFASFCPCCTMNTMPSARSSCCFHLDNTRFYGSVPEPDDTDERPPAECLCAEVKIRTN